MTGTHRELNDIKQKVEEMCSVTRKEFFDMKQEEERINNLFIHNLKDYFENDIEFKINDTNNFLDVAEMCGAYSILVDDLLLSPFREEAHSICAQ